MKATAQKALRTRDDVDRTTRRTSKQTVLAAQPKDNSRVIYMEVQHLKLHPYAQRRLVRARVEEMKRNFNFDSIGVLSAVEYEINGVHGTYAVDGQHRKITLEELGLGEWEVKINLYYDIKTHAESARKFLELNNYALVRPFAKYAAQVIEGDEVAVGVDTVTKAHGYEVLENKADRHLTCASALKRVWALDKGVSLSTTLATLTAAWGTKSHDGRMIEGLGTMLHAHALETDLRVLAKKLAKYPGGPNALVGNATGGTSKWTALGVPQRIANHIIDVYNAGRKTRLESL